MLHSHGTCADGCDCTDSHLVYPGTVTAYVCVHRYYYCDETFDPGGCTIDTNPIYNAQVAGAKKCFSATFEIPTESKDVTITVTELVEQDFFAPVFSEYRTMCERTAAYLNVDCARSQPLPCISEITAPLPADNTATEYCIQERTRQLNCAMSLSCSELTDWVDGQSDACPLDMPLDMTWCDGWTG